MKNGTCGNSESSEVMPQKWRRTAERKRGCSTCIGSRTWWHFGKRLSRRVMSSGREWAVVSAVRSVEQIEHSPACTSLQTTPWRDCIQANCLKHRSGKQIAKFVGNMLQVQVYLLCNTSPGPPSFSVYFCLSFCNFATFSPLPPLKAMIRVFF